MRMEGIEETIPELETGSIETNHIKQQRDNKRMNKQTNKQTNKNRASGTCGTLTQFQHLTPQSPREREVGRRAVEGNTFI